MEFGDMLNAKVIFYPFSDVSFFALICVYDNNKALPPGTNIKYIFTELR